MINRLIKNCLNIFGYNLRKIKKKDFDLSFDQILKKNLPRNPVIFDIGANKGQSIEKYLKLFEKPIIHSFEPIDEEIVLLKEKYKNYDNIYLNNYALGEKIEEKNFNIAVKSDNSSFNNFSLNTEWLKVRSEQNNTTQEQYVKKIVKVRVSTLDNYVKNKNIEKIDLVKIDTQGYEDKILEGSLETIKNGLINIIQTEIMFDNNYQKSFNFIDIEKYIVPHNFRLVGIDLAHDNLFSGLAFAGDIMYFNKNKIKF
jgi:FkbM family methyltransferase